MSELPPLAPTALDRMLSQGYSIAGSVMAPYPSSRHGYVKLERDGEFYFGKHLLGENSPNGSIQADVWWYNAMTEAGKRRSLAMRTPQNIEHGTDWYVAEWIEGKPSAELGSAPSALDPLIPWYAKYLAQLDRVDPQQLPQPPHKPSSQAVRTHLEEYLWDEWCAPALAKGFLAPSQIAAARQIMDEFKGYLKPKLQHGDFVPWHILVDNQSSLWLIDGEHAGLSKPRYLDLAYMYSRIFTYMHGKKQAAHLLRAFSDVSGQHPDSIYPALLPVMTSRAIGMHFDAHNDFKANNYWAEAQDLLARCLSRDPAQLFQAD